MNTADDSLTPPTPSIELPRRRIPIPAIVLAVVMVLTWFPAIVFSMVLGMASDGCIGQSCVDFATAQNGAMLIAFLGFPAAIIGGLMIARSAVSRADRLLWPVVMVLPIIGLAVTFWMATAAVQ